MLDKEQILTIMVIRDNSQIKQFAINLQLIRRCAVWCLVMALVTGTVTLSGLISPVFQRYSPVLTDGSVLPVNHSEFVAYAAEKTEPVVLLAAEEIEAIPELSVEAPVAVAASDAVINNAPDSGIRSVDLMGDYGLSLTDVAISVANISGHATKVSYRLNNCDKEGKITGFITVIPEYAFGERITYSSFPEDNVTTDGDIDDYQKGDTFQIRWFKEVNCEIQASMGKLNRVWFYVHTQDGQLVLRDSYEVEDLAPEDQFVPRNEALASLIERVDRF